MNHLTFEEIVEYVSLKKLDERALLLSSKVDTHIRACEKCLELVRAVRSIHDEFEKMKDNHQVPDFIKDSAELDSKTESRIREIQSAFPDTEKVKSDRKMR